MTPSEDLFLLIKCLSKPQKRYVHLFASIYSGDKVYLKLFDVIDRQKKYNEAAIKKKFRTERFIKQLTRTKYYLYQMILKSLRNYRTQENVEKELREYIDDIEFLFSKQLYKQCQKIAEKAKVLAEKFESIPNLLEILKWEYLVAERYAYTGVTNEAMEHSFQATFNALVKYENLSQYRLSLSRVGRSFYKKGLIRDTSDLSYYENILNKPLFQHEDNAVSYQAKMLFHSSYATYFFLKKNHAGAYDHIKKSILLMEKEKHRSEKDVNTTVSSYLNLAACQINLKKYDEIFATLDRLDKIRDSWRTYDDNFMKIISIQVSLCMETTVYERAAQILKQNKSNIEKAEQNNMDRRLKIVFCFTCSIIYFGMADYSKAISWINKVINDKEKDSRNDIYSFAMFYRLIIHIEMGKTDLLEYSVKSVHRFLKQKQRLYKFETLMLKFISDQLLNKNQGENQEPAYSKLRNGMNTIFKDPLEATILDYFRFDLWVESKIKRKSFKEIAREKIGADNLALYLNN
jgi:hypothetical protein